MKTSKWRIKILFLGKKGGNVNSNHRTMFSHKENTKKFLKVVQSGITDEQLKTHHNGHNAYMCEINLNGKLQPKWMLYLSLRNLLTIMSLAVILEGKGMWAVSQNCLFRWVSSRFKLTRPTQSIAMKPKERKEKLIILPLFQIQPCLTPTSLCCCPFTLF